MVNILGPIKCCITGGLIIKDNNDNIKKNTELTEYLYNRCTAISETLEGLSSHEINNISFDRLLNQLEISEKLCIKYEKKNKIIRFIFSGSYKKQFYERHMYISYFYNDYINKLIILKSIK